MSTPVEMVAGTAVEIFLLTIVVAVIYRVWGWFFPVPKRQIVQPFQRGVVLREGKVEKVLEPGSYWITPKRRLMLYDVRPTPFQLPSQESLTADGMGVRISLAGEYRVVDPAHFVIESSDSFAKFYLELRQALRVAVGEMNSDGLFNQQAHLTSRLKELVLPRETQLGIEMTQLDVYEAVPTGWLRDRDLPHQ